MSDLNDFLASKRVAIGTYMMAAQADPQPVKMNASVEVRGRSGVRVIRIRQFEMISDTDTDLAGFNLGPFAPEHMLAALGGCIAHTVEMVAAVTELEIDSIAVEVAAEMHPLAQTPGYESIPATPHNLNYILRIGSPEPAERITELHRQVEAACPILNLLKAPQEIIGQLQIE